MLQTIKSLKIGIVSRGDASSGGAGRVASLLAQGLRASGSEVRHIVRLAPHSDYRAACERLRGIPGDILLRNTFGLDVSGLQLIFDRLKNWADIVHFHDVSVAYGVTAANWMARRLPVCVSLHDFSLITGGCLFPNGCSRFNIGCGHCPQIGQPPLTLPIDNTKLNFRRHQNLMSAPILTAIAPSEFIFNQAKMGACRQAKIVKIDNPVNTCVFTPERRGGGRKHLDLSDEQKALLFVATQLDDARKGLLEFLGIFREMVHRRPELVLILVGRLSNPSAMSDAMDERIHYLGPIYEEERLADIYAAADCCIIPSKEDNVPCTVAESMSCGTPILARQTGGISEMFEDKCQGVLIVNNSVVEWETALDILLNTHQEHKRAMIRQYALKRYGLQTVVEAHLQLYREILSAV